MADRTDIESHKVLKLSFEYRELRFRTPARTSRDTMVARPSWILQLTDEDMPGRVGIGECAPIYGLSPETPDALKVAMMQLGSDPGLAANDHFREAFPSLIMAFETASRSLVQDSPWQLYPDYVPGQHHELPINGLIWMSELDVMRKEAFRKVDEGWSCIKMKIGGIRFEDELSLIRDIRNRKGGNAVEIRLDANGAFHPSQAMNRLTQLAAFDIHSIEQPIRPGQWNELAELCASSPIPIALDEELIGQQDRKEELIRMIRPAYLVLKPTLHGGFSGCDQWISFADQYDIGWWATSALESNVGLNAIAQWLLQYRPEIPQGLGTGVLFEINSYPFWRTDRGSIHFCPPDSPIPDWFELKQWP